MSTTTITPSKYTVLARQFEYMRAVTQQQHVRHPRNELRADIRNEGKEQNQAVQLPYVAAVLLQHDYYYDYDL